MAQANSEADDAFGAAIGRLVAQKPNPFFVQVGGYDGVSFDPLRPHVVASNLSGIIIEPVPGYFEKLQALYAGSDRVRPINCAIAEEDGERTIWRFNPKAVESGVLPPHFGGISSFLMEDLLAETGVLGRSSPNAETTAILRDLLEAVPVQARTLNSLLGELGVEQVDILQIDTEGYDYRVLQLFDFQRFQPAVVHYEHQHLNGEDRAAAEALLQGHGYHIHREVYDTLAVRHGLVPESDDLRALARKLVAEGRPEGAITILQHLIELQPDTEALLALVQALRATGRLAEALARLPALRAASGGSAQVMAEVEAVSNEAVDSLNACLRDNDMAAAEPYAAGLAALVPDHPEILAVALRCAMSLGSHAQAAAYAQALLAVDPANAAAQHALAEMSQARTAAAGRGEDVAQRRDPSPAPTSSRSLPAPVTPGAAEALITQVLETANALRREGRAGQALPVLQHLAALHPGRGDIRLAHVAALSEQGRTVEAMAELNRLKAWGATPELLAAIQVQAEAAIGQFNACLARGAMDEAERYAAALAELLPQNTAMLQAALDCNNALGRSGEVLRYGEAIVALEPGNREARTALADMLHEVGDIEREIDHRGILALSPTPEDAGLLQLRDLHDAAGLILCRPLTRRSREQLNHLLTAAKGLKVEVPEGTEWEAWARHYRVLVDALDMELALRPPRPAPAGKIEMMASTGEKLDWKSLRARADKAGAECVFFAAADEAYVDLYARWYALSVQRYADMPFLTVIHVIGGKGALKRIAAKVGVADPRLVFTADDFDAAAVTTKIYDAPPKTWTEKPVAHLQSVRFQRLGALLTKLERPVFVSDIDLLLQRGVAELLAAHADDDVVLNENEVTFNAGSRLTANLLLVNPTAHGEAFVAALANYLDDRLAQPEVTRWIDQVGLTMARHNLQANSPAARIGYFDTKSDINNVMYASYQDHPFRFLSLFHGFDTSSLEDDPRVLGESGLEASAA